jgi:hypothetical protein
VRRVVDGFGRQQQGGPAALDPAGRLVFACHWPQTSGIDFCAPLLAGVRAGVRAGSVEALVAHELGHSYAHAMRLSGGEDVANGLMRRWGGIRGSCRRRGPWAARRPAWASGASERHPGGGGPQTRA